LGLWACCVLRRPENANRIHLHISASLVWNRDIHAVPDRCATTTADRGLHCLPPRWERAERLCGVRLRGCGSGGEGIWSAHPVDARRGPHSARIWAVLKTLRRIRCPAAYSVAADWRSCGHNTAHGILRSSHPTPRGFAGDRQPLRPVDRSRAVPANGAEGTFRLGRGREDNCDSPWGAIGQTDPWSEGTTWPTAEPQDHPLDWLPPPFQELRIGRGNTTRSTQEISRRCDGSGRQDPR